MSEKQKNKQTKAAPPKKITQQTHTHNNLKQPGTFHRTRQQALALPLNIFLLLTEITVEMPGRKIT